MGLHQGSDEDLEEILDGVWWGSDGDLVGKLVGCLDPAISSRARESHGHLKEFNGELQGCPGELYGSLHRRL